MNLNDQDLKGLSEVDKLQIEGTIGNNMPSLHNPVRGENEPQDVYNLRRKASKTERLGINLFWDSAKLGTYDPENKQPKNNFKAKQLKKAYSSLHKENQMDSTETIIEHGEGLGISQEGDGFA